MLVQAIGRNIMQRLICQKMALPFISDLQLAHPVTRAYESRYIGGNVNA
jgi:hypothetical protein